MIKIYGTSDDLVEIEGHPAGDEVNCYEKDVLITIGNAGGGLLIRMSYAPRFSGAPGVAEGAFGCWSAEIAQVTEDTPILWPVTITREKYSVCVNVDAPPETPLVFAAVKA